MLVWDELSELGGPVGLVSLSVGVMGHADGEDGIVGCVEFLRVAVRCVVLRPAVSGVAAVGIPCVGLVPMMHVVVVSCCV